MDEALPTPVEYPVHELVRRRWSPRAFSERPVTPHQLHVLLEAARWAPSSFNEQPWSFIVATKDQPEQFERMLGVLVPKNQMWARQAPALMLSIAAKSFAHND